MNDNNQLAEAVAESVENEKATIERVTPMRRFKLGAGFFHIAGLGLMVLSQTRVLAPAIDEMPTVRPLNDKEREGLPGLLNSSETANHPQAQAAISGVTHVVSFQRGFMLSNSWATPAIATSGVHVYVNGDSLDFDLVYDWPTDLMQVAFNDDALAGEERPLTQKQHQQAMTFAMQLLGNVMPKPAHDVAGSHWGTKAERQTRKGDELHGPTAMIHCYHFHGDVGALGFNEDGTQNLVMFDDLYVGVEPGAAVKRERIGDELRDAIKQEARGFDAAEGMRFTGSVIWDEINGKACMRFGDLQLFLSPGTEIKQVQMFAPKSVLDEMGYKTYYEVLPAPPTEEQAEKARSTSTGETEVIAA